MRECCQRTKHNGIVGELQDPGGPPGSRAARQQQKNLPPSSFSCLFDCGTHLRPVHLHRCGGKEKKEITRGFKWPGLQLRPVAKRTWLHYSTVSQLKKKKTSMHPRLQRNCLSQIVIINNDDGLKESIGQTKDVIGVLF